MSDWLCPKNGNHDNDCHRENKVMICNLCGAEMVCQDDMDGLEGER